MKKKKVDLTPHNLGQPNFYWEMEHDGKKGNDKSNYPVVKADKKAGPHLIVFEIEGNNKVTFPAADQIWVKAGSKPGKGDKHPQIPTWQVGDNGKELWVFDWNSNDPDQPPLKLHYQLNFQGADRLDPIIENGGGTVGEEPPPPPPPPPPPAPTERGLTAGAQPESAPTGFGMVGGIDTVALLMGLVVGFILAAIMFKWGR